jgi:hypothetical protein
MLRPCRRKPPYREHSTILRLLSASKNKDEQTLSHAGEQPVGFCGKIDGS